MRQCEWLWLDSWPIYEHCNRSCFGKWDNGYFCLTLWDLKMYITSRRVLFSFVSFLCLLAKRHTCTKMESHGIAYCFSRFSLIVMPLHIPGGQKRGRKSLLPHYNYNQRRKSRHLLASVRRILEFLQGALGNFHLSSRLIMHAESPQSQMDSSIVKIDYVDEATIIDYAVHVYCALLVCLCKRSISYIPFSYITFLP